MISRRNFLFFLATSLVAPAALSGCGGAQNTAPENAASTRDAANTTATSGASEIKSVTVGYLPNIVLPQPLLGFEEGEFARQVPGVKFSAKTFPAGPAALESLRAGVVQIVYTGPYPPIKAYAKDRDIVLLGGTATGGTELMVAQNSPIVTVADLKGKTVGVNQLGSTVDALVRNALLEAKLTPDVDVKITPISPALQADSLKRGEVAAVAAPAPWPSVVKINGGGRALLDYRQILADGAYLSGVYYTTKKFADVNPNFIAKFVTANKKITDDLNADRAKGDARVLAAWEKVSQKKLAPDVAKAAFGTIVFTSDAKLAGLQRDAEIANKVGILRTKADLDGFVYEAK